MDLFETQRGPYTISTDPARLDAARIHRWLSQEAYWAHTRSLETVQRSLEHSLCFGVYCGDEQVGLARVVTDYATFAWLCDVFIAREHRGQGLGAWLIETITTLPELRNMLLLLATRDAHGLYERHGGFAPLHAPERWMERRRA